MTVKELKNILAFLKNTDYFDRSMYVRQKLKHANLDDIDIVPAAGSHQPGAHDHRHRDRIRGGHRLLPSGIVHH